MQYTHHDSSMLADGALHTLPHRHLMHKMVHCYEYNAGGLVEGITDFVRLYADLTPPHWSPHSMLDKWDAGISTQRIAWTGWRRGMGKGQAGS
ncbi:hypothetical protein IW261DRAFT_1568574 [Armillaria novae-zelandiae]|uniref:Uncharacterized protein n=1 Tax=Armillaria novae-zelandiae TaxID=153914 RepID=A0AA39NZ61_9AGAR|nr:hypothetical protein IW261DRAFT_1568574 [Armillaria novae-zelandiae]